MCKAGSEREIKCVVWDLDNTLWQGTLLEDDTVFVDDRVMDILKTLDSRGILQSIASKNDYDPAMSKLNELGLNDYFFYPQISWNAKSEAIEAIAESMNIGIDTLAFIDDQPFELEEVGFSHPQVLCIHASDIYKLTDMPRMQPRFITDESGIRRQLYLRDVERKKTEAKFKGPKEEFLASLNMVFRIYPAKAEDLRRAEELTVRTHQLNTTGITYSQEELEGFRKSDRHILLMGSLDDKFGTYGKIGLAMIECSGDVWHIKLLLMSCRVMSRGVGSVFINHIRNEARKNGVRLRADMVPNDRNRMMYMTYKFSSFREIEKSDHRVTFENDLSVVQEFPDYIRVKIA